MAQEKVVAEAAKLFVVIADQRKKVQHLGTTWKYVPIEVLPMAYAPLQKKIKVRSPKRYFLLGLLYTAHIFEFFRQFLLFKLAPSQGCSFMYSFQFHALI